ncbi:MAG: putative porin [Salibacteraceae bacterium]
MKGYFVALFLCSGLAVLAQEKQSSKGITTSTELSYDLSKNSDFAHVDTVLSNFYHYSFDGRNNSVSLGNPGLAYSSLLFKRMPYGFRLGEYAFDENFIANQKLNVYHATDPFARVSYRAGPKKYQDFDVFFTQNYSRNFNVAVSYNTQSSTGFYINQETVTKKFGIQNSYRTRNGNYGYYLKFKVNSGYAMENGGIKSDSLYHELTKLSPFDTDNNKLKVQVWLEDDFNRYDHRDLYLSQYLRLGQKTIDSNKVHGFYLGANAQGKIDDIWFEGANSDSNYYDRFGINITDSSSVYERSHLLSFRNKGFLKYTFGDNKVSFLAGLNYNYFEYTSVNRYNELEEASVFGKVSDLGLGKFKISAEVIKGVSGYNSDGISLDAQIYLNSDTNRVGIYLGGYHQESLPDYKQLNYGGSIVSWNNDFDYLFRSKIEGKITDNKLKLSVFGEIETIANYVYYNSSTLPVQYDNRFNRYVIEIKKEFVFGSYHFDISVINQGVDKGTPVNLAEWIGVVSFYYQRFLFKNAMELRYGLDYWQTSAYTADVYVPFTRSFTYQNEYKVGDYPYLNFYISARIKGAQGFVNFQNIGQFVFRDNYMMSPNYALQDFGISFGLRWDFYN